MQRYANILGLLGMALIGFGLVTYLFTGVLTLYSSSHLFLGVLAVAYFVIVNLGRLKDMVAGRAVRTAGQTVTTAVLVIVAVVAVNLIANLYPKQFDWTGKGIHSLSPQTEQILGGLETDVHALLFQQGGALPSAEDLLGRYEYASGRFSYEVVDPDREPTLAERYQIRQNGTLVLTADGSTQKVTELDEEHLTNGLIRLVAGKRSTVGFLVGHGERSIEDEQSPGGLSVLAMLLDEQNYDTVQVDLTATGAVPPEVDVLVVAGPDQNLFPNEISVLTEYARSGGDMMVAVDPLRDGGHELVRALGGLPGDNMLLDKEVRLLEGPVIGTQIIATEYADHPLTAGFQSRTLFQEACTMDWGKREEWPEQKWTKLIYSSRTSWGETDLDRLMELQEADLDVGDRSGPLPIGAVYEGFPGAATATAAGDDLPTGILLCDSDFLSNRFIGELGNADLALNMIAWMAGQAEQVAIRAKSRGMSRVTLQQDQMINIFYGTVLVFPELLFLAGLFVWWQRRQQR